MEPAIKTVEESMEYVKKQYAPTFAMFKTHLGVIGFNDYLREFIKEGTERMGMKHEQMLFLSAQKKADNTARKRMTSKNVRQLWNMMAAWIVTMRRALQDRCWKRMISHESA